MSIYVGSIDIGNEAVKMMLLKLSGNSDNLAARPEVVFDQRGQPWMATAVSIGEDNTVLVGQDALDMSVSSPERVATNFKPHLGSPTKILGDRTAEDILTLLLTKAKAQMESQAGDAIDGYELTRPIVFADQQNESLLNAAKRAGINVLGIITEPSAAAFAGTVRRDAGDREMVIGCIDLGSFTLDVSVLRVTNGVASPIATGGIRVGGRDFKGKVVDLLLEKLGKLAGKPIDRAKLTPEQAAKLDQQAERAKVALSQQSSVRVTLAAGGKDHSVELTQKEYHAAIEPLVKQLLACVDQTFASTGKSPADMDAVILAGAPMFSPFLQAKINKHLGVTGKVAGNPALSVAEGAVLHAATLHAASAGLKGGAIPSKRFTDATTHDISLGVRDESHPVRRVICELIVPKGTAVPCNLPAKYFRLEHESQTDCFLGFYQGPQGAPVTECAPIGSTDLSGLPREAVRSMRLQVGVVVANTGLAEVTVTDVISKKTARASVRLSLGTGTSTERGACVP